MVPDVGSKRLAITFPKVVLPDPDLPTSASVSPGSTPRVTPVTAGSTSEEYLNSTLTMVIWPPLSA